MNDYEREVFRQLIYEIFTKQKFTRHNSEDLRSTADVVSL
jgi:hypothetical protein